MTEGSHALHTGDLAIVFLWICTGLSLIFMCVRTFMMWWQKFLDDRVQARASVRKGTEGDYYVDEEEDEEEEEEIPVKMTRRVAASTSRRRRE